MIASKKTYSCLFGISFFISILLFANCYSSDLLNQPKNQQEDFYLSNSSLSPLAQKDKFFQPSYEHFKKKFKDGCLPLSSHDKYLLQSLPLAEWQLYFQEFNETFIVMCLL